jgi:adenylate cyclase
MVSPRMTAASYDWTRKGEELATWLIGPARLTGDAVAVTSGLAERLTVLGLPLHRLRIAMRVDNSLLTAWGIIWAPETAAEIFTISQALRDSPTYVGSRRSMSWRLGLGSGGGSTGLDRTITLSSTS